MVVTWWLFLEKHSTVHKADDILQLVSFNNKKKKEQTTGTPPALTLWSKAATSVDTTPSLSVRSRKIRRFAVKERERTGCRDHLISALMPPWRVEIFAGSCPTCVWVRRGAISSWWVNIFYFQRVLYSHDWAERNPQISKSLNLTVINHFLLALFAILLPHSRI